MSRPNHVQFLSSSDEDEEPPEKKSIFDSTKRSENISKPKPKHIVFVDSSDDEKEPSVSKLRFDSTIDYESKSVKNKKKRSRYEPPIDSIVERSRSDSTKKSKKDNSDEKKRSSTKDLSQTDSVKSISESTKKSKKNSDKKEESPAKEASPIDLIVLKSNSDSAKKIKKNSDQNRKLSVEEASPIDTVVNKSIYDSTKTSKEKISDQKKEKVSDEVWHVESVVKRSISDSTNSNEKNYLKSSNEDASQMKSVKKTIRDTDQSKRNETEIKCTECKEFRSTGVMALRQHLRSKHATNLRLAGLILRCDCGHESLSGWHLTQCKIANYTLIRIRDGPIQTIHDKKVTPHCIFCEKYPATASIYASHLYIKHNSSLKTNELYLLCSCGFKIRSSSRDSNHSKKCAGIEFSVQKLSDLETIPSTPQCFHSVESEVIYTSLPTQCILCEKYPSTMCAYTSHLHKCHKSTLKLNEIFLLCSCGADVYSSHLTEHNTKCSGIEFSVRKLSEKADLSYLTEEHELIDTSFATPQCFLCENEIYLLCSCGADVHSDHQTGHNKKVWWFQFLFAESGANGSDDS